MHVVRLGMVRDFVDGVLAIEQRRRLLQRPVLGLHDVEPQKDEFECEPANVHELGRRRRLVSTVVRYGCTLSATYVVLPSQGLQCDRVDVLVKDEGDRNDKAEDVEPFGTETVWQDFDRIRDNEGSERNVICSVEEEDECNNGMSSRSGLMLSILGEANRLCRVEQGHQSGRKKEEEATTETVDHESREHGPAQVPDLQNTVDEELSACTGNTNLVEDLGQVVRDETVAGPLREKGNGDDDAYALAVSGAGNE